MRPLRLSLYFLLGVLIAAVTVPAYAVTSYTAQTGTWYKIWRTTLL